MSRQIPKPLKPLSVSKTPTQKCPFEPIHSQYRYLSGSKAPCPRTYSSEFIKGACNQSGRAFSTAAWSTVGAIGLSVFFGHHDSPLY